MAVLENLQPQKVFHFFEELCQIPHGTYNTKAISDYCVAFAKERGLEVIQDELNDIIIKKAGTCGYEDSEPVIIQGHMDMVCEKVPGSSHDFTKDPLDLYVEDGCIGARGTSLGGDDGIAVAMGLALLDSDDIPYPPLELLLTVDEEVGMDGAAGVDLSQLKGHKLINLDSEDEGILTVGCAGGARVTSLIPVVWEQADGIEIDIKVGGLRGGHSGNQIHEQRGNAHKLMARLLDRISASVSFRLIEIKGGTKDNVIAMDNIARILVERVDAARVEGLVSDAKAVWENEFAGEEPGLFVISEEKGTYSGNVMDADTTGRVISYLLVAIDGLQGNSRSLKGLVESSLNVGVVLTEEEGVSITHLIRSSVESQKAYMLARIERLAKLVGATATVNSAYPAWQYNPDSELRKVMVEVYRSQYGKDPEVYAVHAGLECGLFLGRRPDLDCVSIGPDMHDIHSFNEKLDIASTQRTWEYLKGILAALK